jgi:ADP-heptose:LPS heptosyltransferase
MRLFGRLWRHSAPYDPVQKDVGRNDSLAFNKAMGFPSLQSVAPSFSAPIWEEGALIEARQRLCELERPILAVSPAAAAKIRQREYPLGKMCEMIAGLLAGDVVHSVVLLGDDQARPRLAPLAEIVGSRGMDCCGELSLAATAALLKECDAALVVDGGLLHIALSTELPVVALYGPTEIYSSDPREGRGRYIAISAYDRCRCNCRSHRGINAVPECAQEAQCLSSIPPQQVVEAVAAVLRTSDESKGHEMLRAPGSKGAAL